MLTKSFASGNKRKPVLLALALCAATLWAMDAEENYVLNGEFEAGIDGWQFFINRDRSHILLQDALGWEKQDTGGKSQGSLKVTMPPTENPPLLADQGGAVCKLIGEIKVNKDTPVTLRIYFAAKSVGGAKSLCVYPRHWEDNPSQTVELSPEWKGYRMVFKLESDSREIIFTLVKKTGASMSTLDTGTFLLDFVEVISEQ